MQYRLCRSKVPPCSLLTDEYVLVVHWERGAKWRFLRKNLIKIDRSYECVVTKS